MTATKTENKIFDANANISVITKADIERMHYESLEDVLRTVTNVQFLNYGMPGYNQSKVRINGSDNIDKDKPINKQVLYKQWRRICKRVGVDKTAVYGLRHTFATLSEKNGLNKECIAAFMGHKHLTTTEGYIDDYRIRMEQKNISLAASELNSKSFINII